MGEEIGKLAKSGVNTSVVVLNPLQEVAMGIRLFWVSFPKLRGFQATAIFEMHGVILFLSVRHPIIPLLNDQDQLSKTEI
jgi:hypothetical protein